MRASWAMGERASLGRRAGGSGWPTEAGVLEVVAREGAGLCWECGWCSQAQGVCDGVAALVVMLVENAQPR